jgi:hypothetical protein
MEIFCPWGIIWVKLLFGITHRGYTIDLGVCEYQKFENRWLKAIVKKIISDILFDKK